MIEPERRPVGRPTKYKPEYCQAVIDAAKNELSLTAFAGSIEVARSTINEWMAEYPEFSEACRVHATVRAHAHETEMYRTDSGPRVNARMFALKNCAPEEWRDKQQIDHNVNLTLADLVLGSMTSEKTG